MDVEKEILLSNARVRALIDTRAREALQRMDDRWPSLINPPLVVEPPANPAEAAGQQLRALHDAFVAFAEAFGRGWTAVDRAQPGSIR
ncbi:hypothetical protein [Microbacterium kunmingense]|uniref:hypothetical protein n=1 Tax=Microbacterium kunmingense TaxID=2915939 RepID=UPI002004B6E0|nr:hypothetical protein [Microbacterium kunmingense]